MQRTHEKIFKPKKHEKVLPSSSCNEHILKFLNNVKCPQNKIPRNRKSVAMKTLVAEIAKKQSHTSSHAIKPPQ